MARFCAYDALMGTRTKFRALARKRAGTTKGDRHPKTEAAFDKVIGYVPRPLQRKIAKEERRFNSEVVHRRFGKTVMKVRKLLFRAMFCPFPKGRYAYAAPTYRMAKDIAWLYLVEYHDRIWRHFGEESGFDFRNMTGLWAEVPDLHGGRARITLYGVDNPKQRMRGLYLDGVVLDEWAQMPPVVWTEQMRPMLSDMNRSGADRFGYVNQWADFILTPFGRNHAHAMHQRAEIWRDGGSVKEVDRKTLVETERKRDDWFAALYRASETGYISAQELEDALSDMGEAKYQQEFECSFDAAVEGAIFAGVLDRIEGRDQIGVFRFNPLLPVNTAWDLGFDDATAIWFFQHDGNGVNLIDYYEASGAGLEHYASVLAERAYRYGYHLFPHDVEQTELGSGKSRRSVLQSLGIRVSTVPKVSVKQDAITAANVVLERCRFNIEKCSDGLDRIRLYRREYDERLQIFREKPVHDWASHAADALMTLACGLREYGLFHSAGRSPNAQIHGEF